MGNRSSVLSRKREIGCEYGIFADGGRQGKPDAERGRDQFVCIRPGICD